MEEQKNMDLKSAIHIHQMMMEYRDSRYINMMNQINTRTDDVFSDDLGSQFVHNCGRDLAGEVVRNCFNTASYNITVDQLAMRILKFDYEKEYDPLKENGGVGELQKSVYNYNELISSELRQISIDMEKEENLGKLFDYERDYKDTKAQKNYREKQRDESGDLYDEITGHKETKTSHIQNGKEVHKTDMQADHVQSREAARYNSKYVTEKGAQELRDFYNSGDNMQILHASANASKGDVRVCRDSDGKVVYLNAKEMKARQDKGDTLTDITSKATPEQLAGATISQLEKGDANSPKIQKLIEQGYLVKDENGNVHVPKAVRKKLEANIRHSQNVESQVILRNTKYKEVAKEATQYTKAAVGKILAGQIIYYAAPPLVFEVKTLLKNKGAKLDEVLQQLGEAAKRIGEYVCSKLKDIFQNVLFSSLKKFIKSFMDILINLVKATIKKLLKIAKNLVLSTVDAIRIIANKNSSAAEKADAVFNLFGVTITNCVIEILFEIIEHTMKLPEWLLMPFQILTSVVCTNLTMLILQKADLFDVRFGFKINAMRKIFEEERKMYREDVELAEQYSYDKINQIIITAQKESRRIYDELCEINPKEQSVREQLENINQMFGMNIDFQGKWLQFIGVEIPV